VLWQYRFLGWGIVRVENDRLIADFGYVAGRAPKEAAYKAALAEEKQRLRTFLSLA
jgi:hypothetical protein